VLLSLASVVASELAESYPQLLKIAAAFELVTERLIHDFGRMNLFSRRIEWTWTASETSLKRA